MEQINEIYALYEAYLQKVKELEKNKKVTDGLLGITRGPKDDPCHDQFAKDLEIKLKELVSEGPCPEEAASLLEYMYTVPFAHVDNRMVYWMFSAVHILALDVIPFLDRSNAQRLYDQYCKDYPRWERLPAQKKTLKALQAVC